MNFGRQEDADEQRGGAADEDLAHQRGPGDRGRDDLEADAARALDEHGVAGLAAGRGERRRRGGRVGQRDDAVAVAVGHVRPRAGRR